MIGNMATQHIQIQIILLLMSSSLHASFSHKPDGETMPRKVTYKSCQ